MLEDDKQSVVGCFQHGFRSFASSDDKVVYGSSGFPLVDADTARRVALRVRIDKQYLFSGTRQTGCDIDGRSGFPDTAFLIRKADCLYLIIYKVPIIYYSSV
jgi:hypothetical protein